MNISVGAAELNSLFVTVAGDGNAGGGLYQYFLNGSDWTWNIHGQPPGTTIFAGPSEMIDNVKFFVTTNDGRLFERWWNGSQWRWHDHDKPWGVNLITAPGAAMNSGKVFVVGENGHLYQRYWQDGQWHWSDEGLAYNEFRLVSAPGAAMTGDDKLFVVAANGHLFQYYWDSNKKKWLWTDQCTTPSSPTNLVSAPVAAPGDSWLFAGSADGTLWQNYWDGNGWQWSNQGTPPNTTIKTGTGPGAAMAGYCVFVVGENGHLCQNYFQAGEWQWADTGAPPSGQLISSPGAAMLQDRLFVGAESSGIGQLYPVYQDANEKWDWDAPATIPVIQHVFVLMLENHSFDNVFAFSGIPGLTHATPGDSNSYEGNTYPVHPNAPERMPTDPGHEFSDVVEQLAGPNAVFTPGGHYPTIDNSGFAANYATSNTEKTGRPSPDEIPFIMSCFNVLDAMNPMRTIYDMATEFAICDQWYSSMPGPTWPNRFFVHGASSSGLDDSPTTAQIVVWEEGHGVTGFPYPHGSIYQALSDAGLSYCFYHDYIPTFPYTDQSIFSEVRELGDVSGATPQVSSLEDVQLAGANFSSLLHFGDDLQGDYPYAYTFIEPHYGNVLDNTYIGGSSQHPEDYAYGSMALLNFVYTNIRNSPLWNSSLLIITYDEHGGFYDSVAPGPAIPPADTPPCDNPPCGLNTNGFNFDRYGVRVPAVVISPLIPRGTVDHTLYDHSSIPKTLESLFGLLPLTNRDAAANDVLQSLSLSRPRTDSPASLELAAPRPKQALPAMTAEERTRLDAQPLPESGNLAGVLYIMRKTEIELSGRTQPEIDAINLRFKALKTRGDARAYIAEVMQKVHTVRQERRPRKESAGDAGLLSDIRSERGRGASPMK